MFKNNIIQSSRIMQMFSAQTYGTVINVVDKLATLPLFLSCWGVDLYGEWLILRAIPAYLSIAELGFANAAANRMSVLLVNNERKLAERYFQSAFVVLLCVSFFLFIGVLGLLTIIDVRQLFNFSSGFSYNLKLIVLLLLGYTALIFQTQLLAAAYRSVGQYAKAAYITYHIRTVELCGLVVVLLAGGGLLAAALCYFLVRFVGSWIMAFFLFRKEDWLHIGISSANMETIFEMLPDATGFLAFPLGRALSLQVVVFIVANFSSPAAVALFSASRTLTLTIVQFGMQINRSVWPELTRLCAIHELDSAKKVYFAASGSFCWLGSFIAISLFIMAPWIFQIWTWGKMIPDLWVLSFLLLAALVNGFWYSTLSILLATNTHKRVGILYFLINTLSLPLIFWLGSTNGLLGTSMAIMITELVVLSTILRSSLCRLDVSLMKLIESILFFPIPFIRQLLKRHANG